MPEASTTYASTTTQSERLADPTTGQLIGCHLIGPHASTVIQAMSFGLDAHTMARGQFWIRPAMSELIENALLKLEPEPAASDPKRRDHL